MIQGARVLAVGERQARSGLKPDDVITHVDTSTVRTPQDFFETAGNQMAPYRLEVFRDGKTLWIWLPV